MFLMTSGFYHIERPDPSDKRLTVNIPTSYKSIVGTCEQLSSK